MIGKRTLFFFHSAKLYHFLGIISSSVSHYAVYHSKYAVRCHDDNFDFMWIRLLLFYLRFEVWADGYNRKMLIVLSDALVAISTIVLMILL